MNIAMKIAAAAALWASSELSLPALAEPIVKEAAPPLSIETAGGEAFDLGAMRGKTVLVAFWATWCGPCLEEFPVIEKFYRQHKAHGFEVIALSIDKTRDKQKMLNLIARLPFRAALLSEASRNGFGTPEAVPVSYVIGPDGVVRDRFVAIDEDLLNEVVLPLLKPSAVNRTGLGGRE